MADHASRRRSVGLAVAAVIVVVVAVLIVVGLDHAAPVDYYRPINDYAISVGTITGPATWTRVTGLTETGTAVTVFVKSLSAPVPSTGDNIYELTVLLSKPLGGRAVINGNTGNQVPRLNQGRLVK